MVRESFAIRAAEKGLSLDISDVDFSEMVVGDAGRLQQVLLNLVGNAVKFTEEGGVSLVVELDRGKSGCSLKFSVSDTGPGVPEEERQRLFYRFEQAHSLRTRTGGVGLGLAICREIVTLMDGHIAVDGQEGSGATFWFEIPVTLVAKTGSHEVC